MSDDDIADAIDNIDNAEDLDDETREKLQKVLAEEASAGGGADASEDGTEDTRVEANPMGARAERESDEPGAAAARSDGGTETSSNGSRTEPIGGIFTPGDIGGEDGEVDSSYLGAEDLEGYDEQDTNPTVFILGGVIVLLIVGFAWVLLQYTEQGERMKHLFKGDLRTYEQAKAEQIEEEFRQEQLAQMPKYGMLTMNGRPKYATVILDGQVQYGKTPKSGEWRPVLLTPTTQFQNLNVADKHQVRVEAPNHEAKDWSLTEDMWTPVGKQEMNFEKTLTVNLLPESQAKQIEFQQRMEKNPDENYFGEVTLTSEPEGAKIIFDGKPLLDEEGEQRTTPVTFEKAYWENEETGEIEEQKVKVDMPPDRGHKIQLRMTDEELEIGSSDDEKGSEGGSEGSGAEGGGVAKKKVGENKQGPTEIKDYGPDEYPKYVTPLERQMWTCDWEDGEAPDEPPYPKHCDYSYELNVDFSKLKDFIKSKKEERKEVKERNEELAEKLEKLKKKLEQK